MRTADEVDDPHTDLPDQLGLGMGCCESCLRPRYEPLVDKVSRNYH